MKANSFFFGLMYAVFAFMSFVLPACTDDTDTFAGDTGIPIRLEVLRNLGDLEIPSNAFSPENPIRVVGFRSSCQSHIKLFEDNAYIDADGYIVFMSKDRCWLGDQQMVFTVFWPADSEVQMDEYGRIIGGNCVVTGHTQPINPILPRKDNTVNSMKNSIIITRWK